MAAEQQLQQQKKYLQNPEYFKCSGIYVNKTILHTRTNTEKENRLNPEQVNTR